MADNAPPKKPVRLAFLLPLIAFAGFALLAAAGLVSHLQGTSLQVSDASATQSVLIGRQAPDLPATALNEDLARDLSAFRGQPVLVNIMASWCAPCRAEIPALALLSEQVPVIAIAYKDKQEDTAAFLSQYGNPFTAVWMDYDGMASIKWGIYGVPETFLLDGEGRVVLRHAGPVFKDTITQVIAPALEELLP